MIGLLRVKNESRWIGRAIDSIAPLCRKIVAMDDHSTDDTVSIAQEHGAIVLHSPFEGLDEVRDKNWLLGQANPADGEWCFMIDGDEELHRDDLHTVATAVCRPTAPSYEFPILYLWDRPDQVRIDGVYGRLRRASLWRYQPGQTFGGTRAGGGFHCSNVPYTLWKQTEPIAARILHWGYMHREDRLRKYQWYRSIDGRNRIEDGYRHMVIGDVFPAHYRFKHGGPLELAPLETAWSHTAA